MTNPARCVTRAAARSSKGEDSRRAREMDARRKEKQKKGDGGKREAPRRAHCRSKKPSERFADVESGDTRVENRGVRSRRETERNGPKRGLTRRE
jgi:hypothetical protein